MHVAIFACEAMALTHWESRRPDLGKLSLKRLISVSVLRWGCPYPGSWFRAKDLAQFVLLVTVLRIKFPTSIPLPEWGLWGPYCSRLWQVHIRAMWFRLPLHQLCSELHPASPSRLWLLAALAPAPHSWNAVPLFRFWGHNSWKPAVLKSVYFIWTNCCGTGRSLGASRHPWYCHNFFLAQTQYKIISPVVFNLILSPLFPIIKIFSNRDSIMDYISVLCAKCAVIQIFD